MEVVIAMLLAAVVIAITYTVFTIVARSYSTYNIKNNNLAVLIRLDELLRRDFEKAEIINKTEIGLYCTNGDKVVAYEFRPDEVIRSSRISDTFKVNMQTVSFLFEHAPVIGPASGNEKNRIDELQLYLLFEEKKITYSYYKRYSSQNLMQRNNDALN